MHPVETTTAIVKLASRLPDVRICQNSVNPSAVHHPERSGLGKNKAPKNIPSSELIAACVPFILLIQRPENVGTMAPAHTKSAIKNK